MGSGLVLRVVLLVRILRIGNLAFLVIAIAGLLASFAASGAIEAHLAAKYHGIVDARIVLDYLRWLTVSGCVAVYPVDRLFRALAAMLATVRAGDPFAEVNATHLRAIGWSLLALQLLDLLLGVLWGIARIYRIEVADWQPSFTGWLAVLAAFVLARVFTAGAAMRRDLDGTV